MDYEIAFIIPSKLTCETVRQELDNLGYEHPVFAASRQEAMVIAKRLIRDYGTRLLISHGATYQYLSRRLNITMLELPFSGLEAALAIRKASMFARKIAHLGTPKLHHYLQASLQLFDLGDVQLDFCHLDPERSLEAQAQEVLDAGYEVIVGGFITVEYAIRHGKHGVEFDVDTEVIDATINNAHRMIQDLQREEEKNEMNQAILQANSDGIIAIDASRNITTVNTSALNLLNNPESECRGRNVDQILADAGIVDFRDADGLPETSAKRSIPVVINELPVIVHEKNSGGVIIIKRLEEIQELDYEIRKDLIAKGFVAKYTLDDILGNSDLLRQEKEKVSSYARYDGTVLIIGETGTGKELFAQSIHNASYRRHQPFVAVNCAALPENLIESELFGYVKGAFTGADKNGRKGLFEMADKGTLFLDEISEIPIAVQSKLLRAIQENEIIRVGGDKIIKVDVRIICSSNKDLRQMIQQGMFKEDLFYRLDILELCLPPLRQRREDIPLLVMRSLQDYCGKHKKTIRDIQPEVMARISEMPFQGNIRELRNLVERMVLLCTGASIDMRTFTLSLSRPLHSSGSDDSGQEAFRPAKTIGESSKSWANPRETASDNQVASGSLKEMERAAILEALEKTGGNKKETAAILGIDPSTLWRKCKKYQI